MENKIENENEDNNFDYSNIFIEKGDVDYPDSPISENSDFTYDTESPQFIDSSESHEIKKKKHKKKKLRKDVSINNMVENMIVSNTETNSWDENANTTITNWYNMFRQQSFIYKSILDRNLKMSERLNTISVLSSSTLGVFAAFKMWQSSDDTFQLISNIVLMFFNFIIAFITSLSKSYLDDKRNDKLLEHIENIDKFLGEISAQLLKSPFYRMDANKFFKINNNKYTKLISSAPMLNINELQDGKEKYKEYIQHIDDNI